MNLRNYAEPKKFSDLIRTCFFLGKGGSITTEANCQQILKGT